LAGKFSGQAQGDLQGALKSNQKSLAIVSRLRENPAVLREPCLSFVRFRSSIGQKCFT
jgi:hypothetical protein